jgi:uncharacterized ion transporter superfamily protein YfcC
MKRITKEPWFDTKSKELKWWKREAPITWQGWIIVILFIITYISLLYTIIFFSKEWSTLFVMITCGMWIPFGIVIKFTSDQPSHKRTSGISNSEINRMLKEKRDNK